MHIQAVILERQAGKPADVDSRKAVTGVSKLAGGVILSHQAKDLAAAIFCGRDLSAATM
jgi:hypothetical protein